MKAIMPMQYVAVSFAHIIHFLRDVFFLVQKLQNCVSKICWSLLLLLR